MPSDFDRVTSKHPCRICNKPKYCSVSRDGRVSICMRISAGAKGRAKKNNGWIHINHDVPVTCNFPTAPNRPIVPLAPIEVRDAIYRELVRLSPAVAYRRQLIDHPEMGLLSRGLLIEETAAYGAFPPTQHERVRLANSLHSFAEARFPRFANLIGIPGLWQTQDHVTQIWTRHNYRMPMLLIPYKDLKGRIQACQLRLHPDDLTPQHPSKYMWLSSPKKSGGCSSGTPIHFTFNPDLVSEGAEIVMTEGALKGDTLASLRPGIYAIATSGVNCAHDELIAATHQYNVLLAFDSDYRTNPAVCAQLASLIAKRHLDLQQSKRPFTTTVLTWKDYKGIDDAALHNAPIQSISTQQWFADLSDESKIEVQEIWREMDYMIVETTSGEVIQ